MKTAEHCGGPSADTQPVTAIVGHQTMNKYVILRACLAGAILASRCLSADDASGQAQFPTELTDSALREGVWVWRSRHHIAEMEILRVVRIHKSVDKWSLTVFTLSHTRDSFSEILPPLVRTDGPYPISVKNGVLTVEQAPGVLKYSCRFYRELFQFPAVTRTRTDTFNFTFSEVRKEREAERDAVNSWSYTLICASNPSAVSSGSASFVVDTPQEKKTNPCVYNVEENPDGPALVFRSTGGMRDIQDQIVWHRRYFGPQIYKSAAARMDTPGLQQTYSPAEESIRKVIAKWTTQEPNLVAPTDP